MPRKRKEQLGRDVSTRKLQKPPQRSAANARERSRMRVLSKAFSRLKTTLPWVPADTKLSKLDTLRLASCYIAHLKQILNREEAMIITDYTHPEYLTWPYTFSGRHFESCSDKLEMGNKENSDSSDKGDDNSSSVVI